MSENMWEYLVVHVNFESKNDVNIEISNPESASDKLKGSLSPEYLKKEFPNQFSKSSPALHPAKQLKACQLQTFLNKCGNESWKLISTEREGGLLMFIFIRERLDIQASKLND